MFNNPLNSFHDIVSDAKEDREQLDRLLTISTPRERLTVALIALVLGILLGWLFFGNVARSLVVDGVLAGQGESMAGQGENPAGQGENPAAQGVLAGQGENPAAQGENPATQGVLAGQGENPAAQGENAAEDIWIVPAFIWAETDIASHIEDGMPVMIETDLADGEKGEHGGTVRAISPMPFAGGPGAIGTEAPVFVHRIDIALDERLDLNTLADMKCRMVIEVGRQTPISLFLTRRP